MDSEPYRVVEHIKRDISTDEENDRRIKEIFPNASTIPVYGTFHEAHAWLEYQHQLDAFDRELAMCQQDPDRTAHILLSRGRLVESYARAEHIKKEVSSQVFGRPNAETPCNIPQPQKEIA